MIWRRWQIPLLLGVGFTAIGFVSYAATAIFSIAAILYCIWIARQRGPWKSSALRCAATILLGQFILDAVGRLPNTLVISSGRTAISDYVTYALLAVSLAWALFAISHELAKSEIVLARRMSSRLRKVLPARLKKRTANRKAGWAWFVLAAFFLLPVVMLFAAADIPDNIFGDFYESVAFPVHIVAFVLAALAIALGAIWGGIEGYRTPLEAKTSSSRGWWTTRNSQIGLKR